MGIKRTPTGRIYYDAGNDRHEQMVGLLGQLGERLKRSEDERDELWSEIQEYRKLVTDIEEKAAKSEKTFLGLQKKISITEKLETELVKRQDNLEKTYQQQASKTNKFTNEFKEGQEALVRRLESGESQVSLLKEKLDASESKQKRLEHRIEKTVQDRMRMARKIERLEETVIEAQDVLRSRALVLLTEQSLASKTSLPQIAATGDDQIENSLPKRDLAKDMPWWQQFLQPQTVSTTFLILLALILGWSISGWQTSRIPAIAITENGRLARFDLDAKNLSFDNSYTNREYAYNTRTRDKNKVSKPVEVSPVDSVAPASATPAVPVTPVKPVDTASVSPDEIIPGNLEPIDTGNYDEEELLQKMEENPEEVAARLNAIEPGVDNISKEIETALETVSAITPSPSSNASDELETVEVEEISYSPSQDIEIETRSDPGPGPDPGPNLHKLIEPDPTLPEAVKKIEGRAFGGVALAQHDLAAIYTSGYGNTKEDYERAAFWFRQAADQGIANARYNLGVLYHQGLGVPQDINEAISWYAKAAELGHPEAQYNLGIAYIEGIGLGYDPVKAAGYFEKAASQKIVEAAYNLGLIHENGLLGQASPEEALLWYKTAADWGSSEAREAMEQLALSLNIKPEEIDRLVDLAKVKNTYGTSSQNYAQRAKSVDSTIISQIQTQLMDMGLYPGPVDGSIGPLTSDAIRGYQKSNGLDINGEPDENLLIHMLAKNVSSESDDIGDVGSRE